MALLLPCIILSNRQVIQLRVFEHQFIIRQVAICSQFCSWTNQIVLTYKHNLQSNNPMASCIYLILNSEIKSIDSGVITTNYQSKSDIHPSNLAFALKLLYPSQGEHTGYFIIVSFNFSVVNRSLITPTHDTHEWF